MKRKEVKFEGGYAQVMQTHTFMRDGVVHQWRGLKVRPNWGVVQKGQQVLVNDKDGNLLRYTTVHMTAFAGEILPCRAFYEEKLDGETKAS